MGDDKKRLTESSNPHTASSGIRSSSPKTVAINTGKPNTTSAKPNSGNKSSNKP